MMKIYGHPWSLNTRKVLAVMAEKNEPIEMVLVNLPKGEQKSPEHLKRHPFGKAPVIDDAGFVLYESQAIMRYLDKMVIGPQLSPSNPCEAARMDQWLSAFASYFEGPAHALIVESVFKRVIGIGDPDPCTVASLRDALDLPLDVADRWLASNAFLAGEAFSLADIAWMPFLEYLSRLSVGRDAILPRKHVASWWARISKRPAWVQVGRTGAQPPIGRDVAVAA